MFVRGNVVWFLWVRTEPFQVEHIPHPTSKYVSQPYFQIWLAYYACQGRMLQLILPQRKSLTRLSTGVLLFYNMPLKVSDQKIRAENFHRKTSFEKNQLKLSIFLSFVKNILTYIKESAPKYGIITLCNGYYHCCTVSQCVYFVTGRHFHPSLIFVISLLSKWQR